MVVSLAKMRLFMVMMHLVTSLNFAFVVKATRFVGKSETSLSAESTQRQPWDVLRFVQQSSKFVNPFQGTDERNPQPGDLLWKAGAKNAFTFGPLDDVVMGGISSSTFDDTTGKWSGQVTDANNGGFVGIRSTPVDWDMSKCKGIEVKLAVPTSMRLKFTLRDSTDFNGVSWASSATVNGGRGGTATIKIPFAKQIPTKFAKTISGVKFSPDKVKGFQLVYSKFEYDGDLNPNFKVGDFQVQLVEIKAF